MKTKSTVKELVTQRWSRFLAWLCQRGGIAEDALPKVLAKDPEDSDTWAPSTVKAWLRGDRYITAQVAFERGQRLARNRPDLLDPRPGPIDFVFASGHISEVAAALLAVIALAQSKYERSRVLRGTESQAVHDHAERLMEYALGYVALAWIIWSNIAPIALVRRIYLDEQKQPVADPRIVDADEPLVGEDLRERLQLFIAEREPPSEVVESVWDERWQKRGKGAAFSKAMDLLGNAASLSSNSVVTARAVWATLVVIIEAGADESDGKGAFLRDRWFGTFKRRTWSLYCDALLGDSSAFHELRDVLRDIAQGTQSKGGTNKPHGGTTNAIEAI